MRSDTLKCIREERQSNSEQDSYIPWKEVHDRVNKMKEETGYKSEDEEQKYRDRKGSSIERKGLGKNNGKGKKRKHGKGRSGPYSETPSKRRSY